MCNVKAQGGSRVLAVLDNAMIWVVCLEAVYTNVLLHG